jgi:hypothetical protein
MYWPVAFCHLVKSTATALPVGLLFNHNTHFEQIHAAEDVMRCALHADKSNDAVQTGSGPDFPCTVRELPLNG